MGWGDWGGVESDLAGPTASAGRLLVCFLHPWASFHVKRCTLNLGVLYTCYPVSSQVGVMTAELCIQWQNMNFPASPLSPLEWRWLNWCTAPVEQNGLNDNTFLSHLELNWLPESWRLKSADRMTSLVVWKREQLTEPVLCCFQAAVTPACICIPYSWERIDRVLIRLCIMTHITPNELNVCIH